MTTVKQPSAFSTEYEQFRDSLFDERWLTERHRHHSYYENGLLERKCARCHRDLVDLLHYRVGEDHD